MTGTSSGEEELKLRLTELRKRRFQSHRKKQLRNKPRKDK